MSKPIPTKTSETLRVHRDAMNAERRPWRESAEAVDAAVANHKPAPALAHRDEIIAMISKTDGEDAVKLAKRPDAYLAQLFLGACRRADAATERMMKDALAAERVDSLSPDRVRAIQEEVRDMNRARSREDDLKFAMRMRALSPAPVEPELTTEDDIATAGSSMGPSEARARAKMMVTVSNASKKGAR